MKYTLISLLISILISNCINAGNGDRKDVKIKSYRTYSFSINTRKSNEMYGSPSKPNEFGYCTFEHEPAVGVRGVVNFKKGIYILDTWNKTVKLVNPINGQLIKQKVLNVRNGFMLNEITVFNDLLYIVTFDSIIYILDEKLNLHDSIIIPPNSKKLCSKAIYMQSKETIKLNSCLSNFDDSLDLYCVDRFKNVTKEVVAVNLKKEINDVVGDGVKSIRGKKYKLETQGGSQFLITDFYRVKLPRPLPFLKTYGAINLDFDENTIVFFDMNQSKFELTIIQID